MRVGSDDVSSCAQEREYPSDVGADGCCSGDVKQQRVSRNDAICRLCPLRPSPHGAAPERIRLDPEIVGKEVMIKLESH